MTPSIDELERPSACAALGYSPDDILDESMLHAVSVVGGLLTTLASLEAENAALRSGLEPFARIAKRTTHLCISPDDPIVRRAQELVR